MIKSVMTGLYKFIKQEQSGWKKLEILWLCIAPCTILSLSLYWGDTLMGIISAVSGVLCVITTAKGKISCFIWGTINTLLYALIAYQANYYGDFMLNMFYFLPFQFIGWYMWKRNMDDVNVNMKVMSFQQLILWIFVWMIAIVLYGAWLQYLGGLLPYVDATSTVLSVWAMYISVKRYTEQWIAWIVIDVVTIVMWVYAFLQGGEHIATLTMWIIYLGNALYGYVNWKNQSRKDIAHEI